MILIEGENGEQGKERRSSKEQGLKILTRIKLIGKGGRKDFHFILAKGVEKRDCRKKAAAVARGAFGIT